MLEERAHENFSTHAKETLKKLDSLITALMTHTEKKYRMLYKNNYEFSPKGKHWLEKGRALGALIRLKLGREDNSVNVKRTAIRCGITVCTTRCEGC